MRISIPCHLPGFAPAAGGADVVECDGASAEEDEGEGDGSEGEGEFVSAGTHQSFVEVNLGDGYGEIDADGEGRHACEQAHHDEDAAEEFGERRDIAGPGRQTQAGDELSMVLESAENFLVSVAEHDCAESEAHDEEAERLQAV
jgi:hypothetical protein